MADIELVIKIDEYVYKDLIHTGENTIHLSTLLDLRNSVRNGTPLPKGHGRLIDADKLQNNISHDKREAFTKHQVWLKASIYNPDALTIIEADKEGDAE